MKGNERKRKRDRKKKKKKNGVGTVHAGGCMFVYMYICIYGQAFPSAWAGRGLLNDVTINQSVNASVCLVCALRRDRERDRDIRR